MTAEEIIELLDLEPLPGEGGYYRETYRGGTKLPPSALGQPFPSEKSISTAIYYLLTPESCSMMHRLPTDEVYHFYLGDPVTLLLLHPERGARRITLGGDIAGGQSVQAVVPAGTWHGSMLREGGRFALMGTTMAPGFDFDDFEPGEREALIRAHPAESELIGKLTGP